MQTFPFTHFSAGDLLRAAVAAKSADGNFINELMAEGKIVPLAITCKLLKVAMDEAGGKGNKFIIDGFPRNLENLEGFLTELGNESRIECVLNFECNDELCWKRVEKRSLTSNRIDDNEESVKKKIRTYNEETKKVLEAAEKFTKVFSFDTSRESEEVFKDISLILESL